MRTYMNGVSKEAFVRELKIHQNADAFIKGSYGQGKSGESFKGCGVGCSLESISRLKGVKLSFDEHKEYETHLGIPQWLARVEDIIFEGVSVERSKTWPVEFAEAIPEGVDLEQVKTPFLVMILERNLVTLDSIKTESETRKEHIAASRAANVQVIEAIKSGDKEKIIEARRAARAAYAAAAYAAAAYAAYAAYAAADAAAAAYAAYAADAAAAAAAARQKTYEYFADQLLVLLRNAK